MRGQISRASFRPECRYSGVYQQQGRMITDADVNEAVEIGKTRDEAALALAVGSGAPEAGGLVQITETLAGDGTTSIAATLRWGTAVVDGIIAAVRPAEPAQISAPFDYAAQADFPEPPPLPAAPRLLYLDVWERPVLAIEDQGLLDPALHGADTTYRSRVLAQVKACAKPATGAPACLDPDLNPAIGDAVLDVLPRSAIDRPDPCDPCADTVGVPQRIGNHLFRLEVHEVEGDAHQPTGLTLKWSAENGAEAHATGREATGFKAADHAFEFNDAASESHLGVQLAAGADFPRRGELTEGYPEPPPARPFVRRWDGFARLARDATGWTLVGGRDRGTGLSTTREPDAQGHVGFAGGRLALTLEGLHLDLTLDGSRFLAGDFWLVVIRERAAEADQVRPVSPTPVGIRHHYLLLGEVADDGGLVLPAAAPFDAAFDAWRRAMAFPPLTDIQARQVGFTSRCPPLYGTAVNVQQALDALCGKLDLAEAVREHQKFLHGWGVVCGLQVRCDGQEGIRIAPGRAVDCEGHTLVAKDEIRLSAEELRALDRDPGEGERLLGLSRDDQGGFAFHLEPVDARPAMERLLEGTLIERVWKGCLEPLWKALEKLGGGDARQLWQPLLHVFWPRLPLFLAGSGDPAKAWRDAPLLTLGEHERLLRLFDLAGELLRSPTDCAFAPGLGEPPRDYWLDPSIAPADRPLAVAASRLWLSPDGRLLLVGSPGSGVLQRYEVGDRELKPLPPLELKPDDAAIGITGVVDIGFDSTASLAVIAANGFGPTGVEVRLFQSEVPFEHARDWLAGDPDISALALPRRGEFLATSGVQVLVRGQGLFQLLLSTGAWPERPTFPFVAGQGPLRQHGDGVNLLAIDAGRRSLLVMSLLTGESQLIPQSDLADLELFDFLATGDRPDRSALHLLGRRRDGDGSVIFRIGFVVDFEVRTLLTEDLGPGEARLAPGDGQSVYLMHGRLRESTRLWHLPVPPSPSGDPGFVSDRHLPLHLAPVDLAAREDRLFVLNAQSRTILTLPRQLLDQLTDTDATNGLRRALEGYRRGMAQAYVGVLAALFRTLRDCLCLAVLPDCPDCGPAPHRVPLAAIRLDGEGRVGRICHLGHRKFLLTFPTLLSWLSIGPLVGWLAERFCCGDEVGGLIDDRLALLLSTPRPRPRPRHPPPILGGRLGAVLTTLPDRLALEVARRWAVVGERVIRGLTADPTGEIPSLLGRPLPEAEDRLGRLGATIERVVDVGREPPDEAGLLALAVGPLLAGPDEPIRLYVRDGRVVGIAPAPARDGPPAEVDTGPLRRELEELAGRRDLLATETTRLGQELEALTRRRDAVLGDADTLREALEGMARRHVELRRAIDRDRPIDELPELDPPLVETLRARGIRTIGELSEARPADLTAPGGLDRTAASRLIKAARLRLGES